MVIVKTAAWQFATAPGKGGGFMGWAKMGPISGTNPFDEPGEHVWMAHGSTRDEAVAALMKEVGLKG